MKYNKDAVNNLINAIFPLPDQFGLDMGSDIPIGMSEIQDRLFHYDKKANIFYGVSKMVITSPALENVVIKIPFNGYLEHGYDEREDDFDDYWFYFVYADDGDDGSNYCWAEYKRYREARKENEGITNDIHERDIDYMRNVYDNAMIVASYLDWDMIDCSNDNKLESIDNIHEKVFQKIKKDI